MRRSRKTSFELCDLVPQRPQRWEPGSPELGFKRQATGRQRASPALFGVSASRREGCREGRRKEDKSMRTRKKLKDLSDCQSFCRPRRPTIQVAARRRHWSRSRRQPSVTVGGDGDRRVFSSHPFKEGPCHHMPCLSQFGNQEGPAALVKVGLDSMCTPWQHDP